jgi:uncharacterized membrane protein YphA (DoxX/SURF4 family)
MLLSKTINQSLTLLFSAIWLINGLFCKVLNLVPRHQGIVARILGEEHSRLFTILIGCSEIMMAIWILSGLMPRVNALMQIAVIAIMNTLEFLLVPDLLLWGRWNAFFALLLILAIYFNEFHLRPPKQIQEHV